MKKMVTTKEINTPINIIPTVRNVDHVGYSVPNLEEAIDFFVNVIGCQLLYRGGPFEYLNSDWMKTHLNADTNASLNLAMLRCGPVTNLELLEFKTSNQKQVLPKSSDLGGHHLAFYVTDIDRAIDYLRKHSGVKILCGPTTITDQPNEGYTFVYFFTPWGLQMELVSYPTDMPYEQTTKARLFGPVSSWNENQNNF